MPRPMPSASSSSPARAATSTSRRSTALFLRATPPLATWASPSKSYNDVLRLRNGSGSTGLPDRRRRRLRHVQRHPRGYRYRRVAHLQQRWPGHRQPRAAPRACTSPSQAAASRPTTARVFRPRPGTTVPSKLRLTRGAKVAGAATGNTNAGKGVWAYITTASSGNVSVTNDGSIYAGATQGTTGTAAVGVTGRDVQHWRRHLHEQRRRCRTGHRFCVSANAHGGLVTVENEGGASIKGSTRRFPGPAAARATSPSRTTATSRAPTAQARCSPGRTTSPSTTRASAP